MKRMSRYRASLQSRSAPQLLEALLNTFLIRSEDWESLSAKTHVEFRRHADTAGLLNDLRNRQLLTSYQAEQIRDGKALELFLGNYRVLERLGAGGTGVVFKAEHLRLRRPVAIKVLSVFPEEDSQSLLRFYAEMRTLARLQHPNLVGALDAGEFSSADPDAPTLHYLVMEYFPGQSLEECVKTHGPLAPARACDLIYQVGCALTEAHRHRLVHRDVKPSNILVTAEEQAKLLDFGIVRHSNTRMTQTGVALGTVDYMAPEQARDASSVDIRADIFGLGGTLYYCLTGRKPFPPESNVRQSLVQRQFQSPPSVRTVRTEVPAALDAVVARMMALKPDDRYPDPQAATRALFPFLQPEASEYLLLPSATAASAQPLPAPEGAPGAPCRHRILVVHEEAHVRKFCRYALQLEGARCDEAIHAEQALEVACTTHYDLVLVHSAGPIPAASEVLQRLREGFPGPRLKIIALSGRATPDEVVQLLLAGADDCVAEPLSVVQLQVRVQAALRLKDAQDRCVLLTRQLPALGDVQRPGSTATATDMVPVVAGNPLVLGFSKLLEQCKVETGAHLLRLSRYARCLAEEAAHVPPLTQQIAQNFIDYLDCCAPLHDLGKLGVPDHILFKPGKLDPEERLLMQAHTTKGAETLAEIAKEHGSTLGFLPMAVDIARHHHERYDGKGYPDRLAGDDIPLAARIVTLCDVYDALRFRKIHKPALSHADTVQTLIGVEAAQFDPLLLQSFQGCASQFEHVARELSD
jgi:response regulator RpfG family c-di-GMP phosphodiesterase